MKLIIECSIVSTILILCMSIFLYLYTKYNNFGDFFIVIEHFTYTKIVMNLLLMASSYLGYVLVRIFAFPGLKTQELSSAFSSQKQNLLNTFIRLLQWMSSSDLLEQKFTRTLFSALTLAHVQFMTQLFEQRVNEIYGEQQNLDLLEGKRLQRKKKQIKMLYFDILRPITLIPLLLQFLLKFYSPRSISASVKKFATLETTHQQLFYIGLHISICYLKTNKNRDELPSYLPIIRSQNIFLRANRVLIAMNL